MHVQPSGVTETASTDYPLSIVDSLLVRFILCEVLLCLEIGFFLCLGVHSGGAEINSSQPKFQTNLEILCEELRLALY